MKQFLLLLLFALSVAGCEGPMGPAGPKGDTGAVGPQGLPGPAGAPGVGTRLNFVVTIDADSTAGVILPATVGSDPNKPPAMACYTSANGVIWLAVSDAYTVSGTPYCGIRFTPITARWDAAMLRAIPGRLAAFVVVY